MIDSEVNTAGVEITNAWLKTHGYFKISVTHVGNDHYIEADGKSRRIFVKLKIAESPNTPHDLTEEEVADLLLNASTVEREPWVAKIQLGENGQLLGEIMWKNMSKK